MEKYFVVYSTSSDYNQNIDKGDYISPHLLDFINGKEGVFGIWMDIDSQSRAHDQAHYNLIMMFGPQNLWKSLHKLTFQEHDEEIMNIIIDTIKKESQEKVDRIMNARKII
jgi:hypothetical protein